jgi:hypothetical protein
MRLIIHLPSSDLIHAFVARPSFAGSPIDALVKAPAAKNQRHRATGSAVRQYIH